MGNETGLATDPSLKNCIFHADDYGGGREISAHMRECMEKGYCNSISILANGSDLKEEMALLAPYGGRLRMSIHLNLAEGRCVSDPETVDLLVDERGMFHISFFRLLLWSCTGKRRKLKEQIRREYTAQIRRLLPYLKQGKEGKAYLRLDSHQHYHLIPVALESLLESVEDVSGRPAAEAIDFLRIPAEPLTPFLKHPGLYLTYRPINLIKNLVLSTLYILDFRKLAPFRKKSAVFMGILLSGEMDLIRVGKLLPDFLRIAKKRGTPLELLCHPGGTKNVSELMDVKNKGCVAFYTSPGRETEKNTLLHIGEQRIES